MKKYRIKEYDIPNDIWIIQRRFLLFWIPQSAITGLEKAKLKVSQMNAAYEKSGSRWYAED